MFFTAPHDCIQSISRLWSLNFPLFEGAISLSILCVWCFLTVKRPSELLYLDLKNFHFLGFPKCVGKPHGSQWMPLFCLISLCKVDELMSYLITSGHKKGMPTLRSCQRETNFPSIDELRSWRGRCRGSWGKLWKIKQRNQEIIYACILCIHTRTYMHYRQADIDTFSTHLHCTQGSKQLW